MITDFPGGIRLRVIGLAGAYLAAGTVVFLLAFSNLDGRLFWGDEAETADLAKNIVKFGAPKVDDGVNHISLHGDQYDARNGLWTWSPWLGPYMAAASFAVFGPTTWAGRAPFALTGCLTVFLLGMLAWKIYRRHQVALAAMLLLGTSEVFLLHIRQCRYYAITVLAEVLLVYGIYQVLVKNQKGGWLIFGGLVMQFYCNYVIALANFPLLLFLAMGLYRQNKSSMRTVMSVLGGVVLAALPWLLFAQTWRQNTAEDRQPFTQMAGFYLKQFHYHFFPWCIVLLPVAGWFYRRWRGARTPAGGLPADNPPAGAVADLEKYLLWLPVLYVPVLMLMTGGFVRYFLPILPVMCLLVAVWVFRYIRWTPVAVLVLFTQCTTNFFAIATVPDFSGRHPLRFPPVEFVGSASSPYEDRFTDVLQAINQQAQPGDILMSWDPELPLVFYTRIKVIDARLTPPPAGRFPDWILPESVSGIFDSPPVQLPVFLKPYYEAVSVEVHDSSRSDNVPEPDVYALHTTDRRGTFVIYRLKAPSERQKQ